MKATTEHTDCRITVKEYDRGIPWLKIDEEPPGLSVLGQGFLGLKLRDGTSLEQAKELARTMNELVVGVTFTNFE